VTSSAAAAPDGCQSVVAGGVGVVGRGAEIVTVPQSTSATTATTTTTTSVASPADHLQVRRRQLVVVVLLVGCRGRRLDDQAPAERVAAVTDDAQFDDAVSRVQSVLDVGRRQQETLPGQPPATGARSGQLEDRQRRRCVAQRRRRLGRTCSDSVSAADDWA